MFVDWIFKRQKALNLSPLNDDSATLVRPRTDRARLVAVSRFNTCLPISWMTLIGCKKECQTLWWQLMTASILPWQFASVLPDHSRRPGTFQTTHRVLIGYEVTFADIRDRRGPDTTRLPSISAVEVDESARKSNGWGIWLPSGTFCPCCWPELCMPCLLRAYKIHCRNYRVSNREILFGIFWVTVNNRKVGFFSLSFVFVECFYSFGRVFRIPDSVFP